MLKTLDGKSITVGFLEIYNFLYFKDRAQFLIKRTLESFLKWVHFHLLKVMKASFLSAGYAQVAQSTLFRPTLIAVVIPIVGIVGFLSCTGRQNGSKLNCVNTLMAYTIIGRGQDIQHGLVGLCNKLRK